MELNPIFIKQRVLPLFLGLLALTAPLLGQGKRLWVLRTPGEMVEYDLTTFAAKQTVKVPADALKSPADFSVNRLGQMLLVPSATPPVTEQDAAAPHKIWFWNGHAASALDQGIEHEVEARGSNQAVTDSEPVPYLSADGSDLYWFSNRERRLDRDEINLSTSITWQAWRTDLSGAGREDVASSKLPDCTCGTGVCDETCPSGMV